VAAASATEGRAAAGTGEAPMAREQDDAASRGPEPSDESLMLAFKAGDARAFESLVRRHRRPLFGFVLRSVHSRARAEELLQEILLRVVRSKDRYERTAKFTTFLYTIARNLCVDESRRQKFRRHASLDQPRFAGEEGRPLLATVAAEQVPTDAAADAPRLRAAIAEAVEHLPDDQREVFLLRQMSGLSFKEIAELVGAPENTVKSRMRYALEKLRVDLEALRRGTPLAAPDANGAAAPAVAPAQPSASTTSKASPTPVVPKEGFAHGSA
jgi:RNA polymerase sigma-70 factor (ECF subfamily)